MGVISNLITDMTLRGADEDELARAVKHSMVVIDAEKHKLDYKRSEQENGIPELKQKWQIRVDEEGAIHYGGASSSCLAVSRRFVYPSAVVAFESIRKLVNTFIKKVDVPSLTLRRVRNVRPRTQSV